LLWIHGGAFTEGSANDLTDPEYLLDEDVVFVSIHYRLGLLGFLAVENSTELTGNLGLKDQQEALRWVQRNIAFFGGDPDKVTIFGESAGAVSVHDHVLSPTAKGLFRAAILQSGTALLSYEKLVQRTTEKDGLKMLEKLGCLESKDTLECLQNLDSEAFVDPELGAQVWPVQDTNSPNPILPFNPMEQLVTGQFNRVPMINGVTMHDGAVLWVAKDMLEEIFNAGGNKSFSMTALGADLGLSSTERLLTSFYLGRTWEGSLEDNQDAITDLHTDSTFASPAFQVTKYHKHVAPVFSYILASRCNDFTIGAFFNVPNITSDLVAHADDLPCIFKHDGLLLGKPTKEQKETIKAMVREWTSFAKNMRPSSTSWTSGGSPMIFGQPESRVLDEEESKTLIFQDLGDRMELWDALYWQKKKEQLKDLAEKDLLQALSSWNWQYQTTRGRQ